jgi:hypothetical protein
MNINFIISAIGAILILIGGTIFAVIHDKREERRKMSMSARK